MRCFALRKVVSCISGLGEEATHASRLRRRSLPSHPYCLLPSAYCLQLHPDFICLRYRLYDQQTSLL
jgi:hypothetical protein